MNWNKTQYETNNCKRRVKNLKKNFFTALIYTQNFRMYYVRKSYGFETKFSLKFLAHYVDKLNFS